MTRLAIFASGSGSNAEKIIQYFDQNEAIQVSLIVSNKPDAGVLNFAEHYDIPSMIIDRNFFYNSQQILFELNHQSIDFLVLAGFLWLLPAYLIKAYPNKILNIHPALLPKYGGKGMYGKHVHQAVKAAGDEKSGITIHFVNENYDEGTIVFQKSCRLEATDTPEQIARKVQDLEHQHFSTVIEQVVSGYLIP